jgi:hypothetical protein
VTCEVCRPWTAATWEEYATRVRSLRDHAETPARCPHCNGTDWATTAPPPNPRAEAPSATVLVALAIAAAIVVILLALFKRLG